MGGGGLRAARKYVCRALFIRYQTDSAGYSLVLETYQYLCERNAMAWATWKKNSSERKTTLLAYNLQPAFKEVIGDPVVSE
jgi:hypothetical protein